MPNRSADKLNDVIEAGKNLGLSVRRKGFTKKKKRRIMTEMRRRKDRCFCAQIFEDSWFVHNYSEDPVLREFEYYYKYDFHREGPRHKANMRKCRICGGEYSDAPPMA